MPPLTGVAVKVTDVPAHIVVLVLAPIVTSVAIEVVLVTTTMLENTLSAPQAPV